MASADPFGFDTVTGAGVSASKSSKRDQEMTEKAKNNIDYKQLKDNMEPPKADKAATAMNAKLMNQVARELEKQSMGESLSAAPEGSGKDERLIMISKINRYMALPKNANRQIPNITNRTTDETLKAIIYDLENGSVGGGEMAFGALYIASQLLVKACDTKLNVVGANLTNLDKEVAANKQALMPPLEELAIKYSHLASTGPWTTLGFILAGILYDTHATNTDPEYAKKKAALKAAMSNPAFDPEAIAKNRTSSNGKK